MGKYGDPFTTTVPPVGSAGTGYATDVDALLQEMVDRLASPVPISSLDNTDQSTLEMNNGPLNGARYVALYEQAALPSGAPAGRVVYYAGNFYFVTSAGSIQVTSGSGLNAGAIGGIVGDYGGAAPAKVSFVAAEGPGTYEFYTDQGGGVWADLKAAHLVLVDQASSRTVTVGADTTIAGDYAVTLPPAPPASGTSVLVMTAAGAVHLAENTAPTNQVGDGVKHSEVTQWYSAAQLTCTDGGTNTGEWQAEVGTATISRGDQNTNAPLLSFNSGANTSNLLVPAPPVGRRVKKISARIKIDSGTGTATITVTARKYTDGAGSAVGSTATDHTVGSWVTVSSTMTDTVADGDFYRVAVQATTTGTLATTRIHAIGVTYDNV